jgi:hypothetical protein
VTGPSSPGKGRLPPGVDGDDMGMRGADIEEDMPIVGFWCSVREPAQVDNVSSMLTNVPHVVWYLCRQGGCVA